MLWSYFQIKHVPSQNLYYPLLHKLAFCNSFSCQVSLFIFCNQSMPIIIDSLANMLKNRLPRDFKAGEVFRVQLSSEEMAYLSQVLPSRYSLILEPKKNVPKHIIQAVKKKAILQNEDSNSHAAQSKGESHSLKKTNAPQVPAQNKSNNNEKAVVPKSNNNSNANKWVDQLSSQWLKKAAKILALLKVYKSSWPFLTPVDAQALEIPEYYELIKEPMDLQTVEQKIRTEKYGDYSEFHADILKIIENSLRFNEANQEYLKITSDFQSYFFKLNSDNAQESKSSNKNIKKKKKTVPANKESADQIPLTLMEKKQLAQQIRRLGKEHLKGLNSIVFDSQEDQKDFFDLEKLSQKKLRELQKYVRSKIIAMEEKTRNTQIQKVEISNFNFESEESSFLTDSDGQK